VARRPSRTAIRRGARGELRVVRGDDHRRAVVGSQVPEQVDDLAAGGGIEIAGRLVGEHDARLDRERARDRDPLPLASGQVPRQVVGARSQPDLVEQPQRAFAAPSRRHELHFDVLDRGQRRNHASGHSAMSSENSELAVLHCERGGRIVLARHGNRVARLCARAQRLLTQQPRQREGNE
jgi:hypothetical protein